MAGVAVVVALFIVLFCFCVGGKLEGEAEMEWNGDYGDGMVEIMGIREEEEEEGGGGGGGGGGGLWMVWLVGR